MDDTEKKILKQKNELKDFFFNNTEIKNLPVKINLKKGESIRQQKGKPIPIHVQDQVVDEIRGLIRNGYLERATETTEERTPAVITMTKDKLVKFALDSKTLKKAIIKRNVQMPNMEELKSRISLRISEEEDDEIW